MGVVLIMKDLAEQTLNQAKSKIASLLKQADWFDLFAASWMLMSLLAFLCGVVMVVALTMQALIGMVFSS